MWHNAKAQLFDSALNGTLPSRMFSFVGLMASCQSSFCSPDMPWRFAKPLFLFRLSYGTLPSVKICLERLMAAEFRKLGNLGTAHQKGFSCCLKAEYFEGDTEVEFISLQVKIINIKK